MSALPEMDRPDVASADNELLIVAIQPAPPGWWAVWRDADDEVLEPVPVFALVETTWHEQDLRGTPRAHRLRWTQAMVHDGEGAGTLSLVERSDGYCGLRYYAPGTEPATARASASGA